MATLPAKAGHPTLVNWAKFLDPNGKPYDVAELLAQSNDLIRNMTWIQGNLATGHKAAVRAGLPTVQFRRFYQGVKVSKSDRAIIEDVCAMLTGRAEVDKALADLEGEANAFRMSESRSFVEAMTQTATQTMIYGDVTTNKDAFTGLTPRYNSLTTGNTAANIIDCGGTGSNNTSLWLVVWGDETVTGIFPKGSKAGLNHQDLGEIDLFDANGDRYRGYSDIWDWNMGLHIKDWRYAVRAANINVSDLVNQTGTQANTASTILIKVMARMMARIPSMGMGKATFLANRTVKEMLSIQAMDRSQNAIAYGPSIDQFGHVAPGSVAGTGDGFSGGQVYFQGVPILTVDRILSTEARVV